MGVSGEGFWGRGKLAHRTQGSRLQSRCQVQRWCCICSDAWDFKFPFTALRSPGSIWARLRWHEYAWTFMMARGRHALTAHPTLRSPGAETPSPVSYVCPQLSHRGERLGCCLLSLWPALERLVPSVKDKKKKKKVLENERTDCRWAITRQGTFI